MVVKNPILSGFYPDPSICAVGKDFYLVNSSFTYFPGLPVMHSRDLCHWEQIGNVMERESQLNCMGEEVSRGLFAPTIRYHEGTYYVICTNVSGKGNFIVTATDPKGPWSDPYYLEGAEGIDPSLFFDDDGRCYYIGTHENPEGCKYNGDWYIWIQEIDLKEMKLIGEHKNVWNGAMKNIIWPEGPHLYKKNGYYYILHAEGGTGPHHAVTVCRSKNIWGPYENNFCNPILTHRHMGKDYKIQYVGHADLVETEQGDWYAVMLAVRPLEGYTTMGRETFLAKVTWEEDWPVMNAGVGLLEDQVEVNLPEAPVEVEIPADFQEYDLTKTEYIGDEFLFLRSEAGCKITCTKEGWFMKYGTDKMPEAGAPSYLALRQRHHNFDFQVSMTCLDMSEDQKAGIVLFQNSAYHLRLELSAKENRVQVVLCENGEERGLGTTYNVEDLKTGKELLFGMQIKGLSAELYIIDGENKTILTDSVDVRKLSTEVAGGFVGCTMGPYATEDTVSESKGILLKNITYQGY